jgi:hypothetical protein
LFKINFESKKVMRFESRRGQNEEKWKKKRSSQFEKTYFLYCSSFLGGPLALHFKDDL